MTIDPRTQALNNPFIPSLNSDGTNSSFPVSPATPSTPSVPNFTSMDSLPGGGAGPSSSVIPSGTAPTTATGNTTVQGAQNDALMQILLADDYEQNALNSLRQPTYHFRLFMTTEHELITNGGSGTLDDLYNALDNIPQATIAESGVTAGFNITEVEIDHAVGPGWRNRNAYMSDMKIVIVEPLGTSLMEAILTASQALGVSNFNKMWYYLELTFLAYNEDGTINASPLDSMNLPNGGRWVYQIMFTDVQMHMSELGAQYTITCVPYGLTGFEDNTCGRTPDHITAAGTTIQEFCDNFAKNLTKSWSDRYLGEIFKFNIVIKPIQDDSRNPATFKLKKTEQDPIRNLALDDSSGTPTSQIPAKTSIIDVITFLYAYCEDAQKMILDTNSPSDLEDTSSAASTEQASSVPTATYNNKQYRVPIVPVIESDVKVTGYDPITGQYMKEITYTIWSYRSYVTNMSVSQFQNIKNDPRVAATIAQELKTRGYLKKRYEYQFTGLNTEIIRYNIDYNFQFASILPKLTGWRQDFLASSVHQKVNKTIGKDSTFDKQPSEVTTEGGGASSTASGPSGSKGAGGATGSTSSTIQGQNQAGQPQSLSVAQIQQKLPDYQTQIDNLNATLSNPTSPGANGGPMTAQERAGLQAQLATVTAARDSLKSSAAADRAAFNANASAARTQIEQQGSTNVFAEDAINGTNSLNMTYIQAHSDIDDGVGNTGQWHRGASLVGALMNQIYSPSSASLLQVEMEIRGDPYWIGYSYLERRAVMSGALPLDSSSVLPNYAEGDSSIALIFRFPSSIDPVTGIPTIRNSDIFNGLYRVVTVKNSFIAGEFKQTLNANKLELINPATPPNTSTGTGGNITNPNGNTIPNIGP